MNLQDYKVVNYSQFQKELHKKFSDMDCKELSIAANIGVDSVLTIRNCFNLNKQMVSDTVLTKVMDFLKLDGFVLWAGGVRKYYIRNSK